VELHIQEPLAENSFPAEVRDIQFGGATSTVRVDANGLTLEALVLQPNGLQPGAPTIVHLPTGNLSLLKNE
jgi:hypothetical protein